MSHQTSCHGENQHLLLLDLKGRGRLNGLIWLQLHKFRTFLQFFFLFLVVTSTSFTLSPGPSNGFNYRVGIGFHVLHSHPGLRHHVIVRCATRFCFLESTVSNLSKGPFDIFSNLDSAYLHIILTCRIWRFQIPIKLQNFSLTKLFLPTPSTVSKLRSRNYFLWSRAQGRSE